MNRLENVGKFLEWRRARLWRTIGEMKSRDPWKAERAQEKVEKDLKNLETAFRRMHEVVSKRRLLFIFLLAGGFLLLPSNVWAAGVISTTFDVAGDIIAIPFKAVGGLFQALF